MCCGIAGTYSILMQEKFFSGCTTCQDQILTKKEGETLNIITCYCISSIKKYQHEYSHKTCCISYKQNKIVLKYFRCENKSWFGIISRILLQTKQKYVVYIIIFYAIRKASIGNTFSKYQRYNGRRFVY